MYFRVTFLIAFYGDDFVGRLLRHEDSFAHMYATYDDVAYKIFVEHSDELLELPVSNKDEAIELVVKHGEEVLKGIQTHGDEFMQRYADEGKDFIDEYLDKGDEVFESGSKTYTVDPSMQAKDIEMGVLIDGAYIKNPTAQNMSDLIKPGSNYVGNSKMNGQFMYVVDTNGNIVIGSRAGQHMPHPTLIGGTNPTV